MNTKAAQRLLAVGAVHIDDTARPVGSLIDRASNPVRWTRSIGGVSANALQAARRESSSLIIDFVATIGDDAMADTLTTALQGQQINTRFIKLDNTATGRYSVILDEQGELYIGLADVDNAERLTIEDIIESAGTTPPDAVLIDTNLHPDTIAALAEHTSAQWQCPLIALAVSPTKALKLLPVRHLITLLIANRREATALVDALSNKTNEPEKTNTRDLTHSLSKVGFSTLIVTDGSNPITLYSDNTTSQIPVPTQTIRTTVNGAGDAMAGAIITHWINDKSLDAAIKEAGLPAASRILSGNTMPQQL